MPRERRGNTDVGDPYVWDMSSCGDNGTGFKGFNTLGLGLSFGGICKDKPRVNKEGRCVIAGLGITVISSLDVLADSRILGEGESIGGVSERERAFAGDDEVILMMTLLDSEVEMSSFESSTIVLITNKYRPDPGGAIERKTMMIKFDGGVKC